MQHKPGMIERVTGTIFRWLMAYLFAVGLLLAVAIGVVGVNPRAVIWGGVFMLPYLAVRHRDPDSTTIPLAARLEEYRA